MNFRKHTDVALLFLIIMYAGSAPAYAYIDPVTTSIVLQAVVGGVAAMLVAIRRFRDRVFSIFKRKPYKAGADQDASL
jgi:hypothetical protein